MRLIVGEGALETRGSLERVLLEAPLDLKEVTGDEGVGGV